MKIVYTKHAKEIIAIRSLKRSYIRSCLMKPDMVVDAREGKQAFLKDLGVNYLKVIAKQENNDLVVITAYWIEKHRLKE